MPVGEWEEAGRRCASFFPPSTPFSAPGGEGSPGTLGTRQAKPLGCSALARCRVGRFAAPTGNFQVNDEPGLRIKV